MSDYKILSSKIDYSCPWFKIRKEEIQYPNGAKNTYYIVDKGIGFITVLGFDQDKLITLKQWRSPLRSWLYEVPMGGVEKNETPLQAAKREFMEETGYKAKNWIKIGELYVAAGHTNQKGHIFLATDLHKVKNGEQNHPHEIIEVHHLSLNEIDKMIANGQFQDGPTLSALYLYKVYNKHK